MASKRKVRDTRHANVNWKLPIADGESVQPGIATVALLMDIRGLLQQINRKLDGRARPHKAIKSHGGKQPAPLQA